MNWIDGEVDLLVWYAMFLYVLQESLQNYAFLVFVFVCVFIAIYIIIVLPETKNKTFMEISQSFAKINNVPQSVEAEMEDVLDVQPEKTSVLDLNAETVNAKHPDRNHEDNGVVQSESCF